MAPESGTTRKNNGIANVRAIAATVLTQEQRDSLAGIDDNPQCINAIDVFGLQTHYGCKSINNGGTYTTNAIESYIDGRIAVYEEYAKILINGGLSATKLLEVHLTVRPPRLFTPLEHTFTHTEPRPAQEIDFLDCTTNLYNYVIDTSTGRPFPAADGRSPYQDPTDSEQYSKFYVFAWSIFTSCLASPYCTHIMHWGTTDSWRWVQSFGAQIGDHLTLFVSRRPLPIH